jgi:Inner membrane protein YgaP-like, transmembrane domain
MPQAARLTSRAPTFSPTPTAAKRSIGATVMNTDRIVFALAGAIILTSLALGMHVNPYWYALTAFMGANLMQASITGFCPLASLLRMLGVRPGPAFR